MNGYVAAKDRSTGKPVDFLLVSVNAMREPFEDLVLDEPELDPVLCLRRLNAIVSPHPYDLEPVQPVVQFDLARFRLVEGMDVAAGLDSRLDLLEVDPLKFENLVRELFTAIGMKAWVTRRPGTRESTQWPPTRIRSSAVCVSSRPSVTAMSLAWSRSTRWLAP
jgi:restriction system protein